MPGGLPYIISSTRDKLLQVGENLCFTSADRRCCIIHRLPYWRPTPVKMTPVAQHPTKSSHKDAAADLTRSKQPKRRAADLECVVVGLQEAGKNKSRWGEAAWCTNLQVLRVLGRCKREIRTARYCEDVCGGATSHGASAVVIGKQAATPHQPHQPQRLIKLPQLHRPQHHVTIHRHHRWDVAQARDNAEGTLQSSSSEEGEEDMQLDPPKRYGGTGICHFSRHSLQVVLRACRPDTLRTAYSGRHQESSCHQPW